MELDVFVRAGRDAISNAYAFVALHLAFFDKFSRKIGESYRTSFSTVHGRTMDAGVSALYLQLKEAQSTD